MIKPVKLPFILLGVFSLNAQVTAVLNRFPARSPEIEIQNNSAVNLTAFAVSMAPRPEVANTSPFIVVVDAGPFIVFVDAAFDTDQISKPHSREALVPLPPNEQYIVPVTAGFRGGRMIDLFEPPVTIAAIFADGSTTGDAALLSRLVSRRGTMLQAVELAHEILAEAGRHNVPRDQLVKQFRTMADSLNHWYLPPEQQVGRTLYESIVEKLMNLPQQQVGSAFPPTTFVDQELTELNRQRVTLLESQPSLGLAAAIPKRQ
jgi:hypothetical protein